MMLFRVHIKRHQRLLSIGNVLRCFLTYLLVSCNGQSFTENIDGRFGDSIDIPCHIDRLETVDTFRLRKLPSQDLLIYSQTGGVLNMFPEKFTWDRSSDNITLHDVTISDGGNYKCYTSYPAPSFNTLTVDIALTVCAPPSGLTVYTADGTSVVEVNEERIVRCRVDAVYPSNSLQFSITSDDQAVQSMENTNMPGYWPNDDGTFHVFYEQSITFIKAYNLNKLTCNVGYNECGGTHPVVTAELSVIVQFKPTAIQVSTDASIPILGGHKTVTCVTDSLNPVDSFVAMRWKRGNSVGSSSIVQYDDIQFTPTPGIYGGRIVSSTYTFIATRADNGAFVTCVPRWREGSSVVGLTDIQQNQTITVYYAHTVSLSGCGSGSRNDGTSCTLTCDATGGNPNRVDRYQWQFKPKFSDVFEDLSTTGESHGLSDISHSNAGDYNCTATNAGGSAYGMRTITVIYAPIADPVDPGSTDTKTFYAALGHNVTLWLAVHSYPNNADFMWVKNRAEKQDQTQRSDDDTNSTVTIRSVDSDDYGEYTVTVTNGGSRSNEYTIILKQRGKPGPATDLVVESRSYREIIITFMPGLDGGFDQTITAEIQMDGASSFRSGGRRVVNPHQQQLQEISMSEDLDPSTTYVIQVVSDNDYGSGSASVSDPITVTTRGEVDRPKNMEAEIDNGMIILSWSEPRGEYTMVEIEQCNSTDCSRHNVTTLTSIALNETDGTRLSLIVKQDRDEVILEGFELVNKKRGQKGTGTSPGASTTIMIGAIVGGLVVAALIAGLVILIIHRRRTGGGGKTNKEKTDAETTAADDIMAVDPYALENGAAPLRHTAADDIMAVDPYALENGAAPLRHTDNGEEPNAPIYGKVDISKKKKNRPQQPTGETGDAPTAVYAQVDPRTKKNNRAPAPESNQTSNSAPKSSQPHRPAPPNPSTRPKIEAKPAPKAPAESPYTNVPQPDLGENPYSNVQDLQQGNPAPSEQGPYAPSEQGPYANVSYPPPAAPAADTNNLIYADLSFDRGQPGTAPKPQIIHGAEDTVEYSTVDFNRSAPAPQESESEDEEDVNKRQ